MRQLYFILTLCMFFTHQQTKSWGGFCNEYRVTFKDGRQVHPIKTCSWCSNWSEKDGLTTFYWRTYVDAPFASGPNSYNDGNGAIGWLYFKVNMETIRNAGVEDLIVDSCMHTEHQYKDDWITFKDVINIEKTK